MNFQVTDPKTTPHENNTEVRGPWMLTGGGNQFFPTDPLVGEFRIDEIAGSLAKTCRYNGQIPADKFYSVAEHCCLLAKHFIKKKQLNFAKWAWAHDGAESYIGDMIRPIKWLFPEFVKIEHKIEKVYFYEFLHLEGEFPAEVKHADGIICNDERTQIWKDVVSATGDKPNDLYGYETREQLGVKINCWGHKRAKKEYLKMYDRLFLDV